MDVAVPAPRLRDPAERVSPRAKSYWTVSGILPGLVLVVGYSVAAQIFDWPFEWWWAAAAVVFIVVASVGIAQWRFVVHRFEVTDSAVYTQTGWWRRERRIAPMSRIQTVDHVEGALARMFRLASVTVTTASAAGALEIAGLDRDRARALVDDLTIKADSVPGDAT